MGFIPEILAIQALVAPGLSGPGEEGAGIESTNLEADSPWGWVIALSSTAVGANQFALWASVAQSVKWNNNIHLGFAVLGSYSVHAQGWSSIWGLLDSS